MKTCKLCGFGMRGDGGICGRVTCTPPTSPQPAWNDQFPYSRMRGEIVCKDFVVYCGGFEDAAGASVRVVGNGSLTEYQALDWHDALDIVCDFL